MSTTVNLRLRDDQVERLRSAAGQMGWAPDEAAALLLEEALRLREFAFIEFRDSRAGRQAYLQGTRLEVWWIAHLAWDNGLSAERIASLMDVFLPAVESSLAYAAAYQGEMRAAIAGSLRGFEELARIIPGLERFTVDATDA